MKRLKGATAKAVKSKTMSETDFFSEKYMSPTDVLMFNLAVSGRFDGGLPPGVIVLAGMSKVYKTITGWILVKAYLDANPEGVCIFYDSEFGGPGYPEMIGIDTNRVIHVPIANVEELTFDAAKKLEEIKEGEKVCFFIDSIGMLASKREADNAQNENGAMDMTRAKSIKGFFRIVTPEVNGKHLPLIAINSNYAGMDKYNPEVMSGGGGILLAANTVLFFNKSKHRDGGAAGATDGDVAGHNFRMGIHKSRFIKEGTKLPFQVLYGQNMPNKYSGLYDMAVRTGDIFSPSRGWRAIKEIDPETGKPKAPGECKKYRESEMQGEEFWEHVFKVTNFKKNVERRISLTYTPAPGEDDWTSDSEEAFKLIESAAAEDADPETGEVD